MDPYEYTGRHRPNVGRHFRKRNWMQKLLVRLRIVNQSQSLDEFKSFKSDVRLTPIRPGFLIIYPVPKGPPNLTIYPLDTSSEIQKKGRTGRAEGYFECHADDSQAN
ncbi:MAG: hypothetical protein JWM07_76 [Candidatus Saccharibacteria bacterium]|nr:hypothetical protein [Candidatus Saccharibacteria bacterium]